MSTWNSPEMSFKTFQIKYFYSLPIHHHVYLCLKLPPLPSPPAILSSIYPNLRGKSEYTVFPKWSPKSFDFRWKILYTQFKSSCILYTKTLNFKIRWFANENWKKCHYLYLSHLSFFCNLKKRRCSDKTPTAIEFSRCIKPAEGTTYIS